MQTFDQSLMQLYKEGKVTIEAAMHASSNPHEFSLRLKGIQASSDTTWDRFEESTQQTDSAPSRI
jgi:twitching motility protein PilT